MNRQADHLAMPPAPRHLPHTDALPPSLLTALRQTRPWITLFAVLALLMATAVAYGGVRGFLSADGFGARAKSVAILLLSLIYFLPSLYLFRYRAAIQHVLAGGGLHALATAMTHQKSFWRTAGITTLLSLALYAVVMVVALIALAVMHARLG